MNMPKLLDGAKWVWGMVHPQDLISEDWIFINGKEGRFMLRGREIRNNVDGFMIGADVRCPGIGPGVSMCFIRVNDYIPVLKGRTDMCKDVRSLRSKQATSHLDCRPEGLA